MSTYTTCPTCAERTFTLHLDRYGQCLHCAMRAYANRED